MDCPHCKQEIEDRAIGRYLASKGGSVISEKKTAASRENAKKGGWPKGKLRKPASTPAE